MPRAFAVLLSLHSALALQTAMIPLMPTASQYHALSTMSRFESEGKRMNQDAIKMALRPCATAMDRRSLLIAGGTLAVPGAWGLPFAAEADDATMILKIGKGVTELGRGGSLGPTPMADMIIGVVDDGAPEMRAAIAGVKRAGAQAVVVPLEKDDPSLKRTQEVYKAGGCLAVIVKDTKQLNSLMNTGAGLECEYCSLVGAPTSPPRWIIVMNSQGKTSKQLEAEGAVSGRTCDTLADGSQFCMQLGLAVPAYGAEDLDKLVIDPSSGFRACGGGDACK